MICVQCGCILPDEDKSVVQYSISNKRVCKKHYDEISDWMKIKSRTYKEWDMEAHKNYPLIWEDDKFYKKLGKY